MNSDKKKRLIIPVATLMVAIVMMAGVGYAVLQSTFTVEKNTTAGGEFSVTVDSYDDTKKLFNDAKIPYVVETLNGTATNKVIAGDYVLADNVSVKVTDNTGLEKAYTVAATADSTTGALTTALGEGKYTLVATLEPASETRGPFTGNQTFTLKVVLKVTADVDNVDASKLTVKDITVTITATHTS